MKLGQPVMCARHQEGFNFVTAKIENMGAPVLMEALARIFMFKQGRAVKAGQCPAVLRKVRGYPVQNDADIGLVAGVDQMPQLVGRAESTGWCKVACALVAPRFIQRVFGNRHEFDVRVAHTLDVRHQIGCQFAVAVKSAIRMAFPGTGMHFVNIDGTMQPVPLASFLHPGVILPAVLTGRGCKRCRAGA